MNARAVSEQRDQLGECPRWHAETQTLWWVDILQHQIHHLKIATGEHGVIQLNEEIGCFIWRVITSYSIHYTKLYD